MFVKKYLIFSVSSGQCSKVILRFPLPEKHFRGEILSKTAFYAREKTLHRATGGSHVELPRKMQGAVPGDGVPGGRICGTEKLNRETDTHHGVGRCESDDPAGRLPGRTAGRAANDLDIRDFSADHRDGEFRRTKAFAIAAQADLPG